MTEGNFSDRIKNGDIKAFEEVFKLHYVKLTLFANRLLNDIDASKEIVSESLTYLWEKRETIVISSSLSGYLYKMVQNRSMNYLKHQKVQNEYVSYLIRNKLIDELPEYETDPFQEKELACQIRRSIDLLPEKCRQVFILSRFEYLKNREIAEKLNISTNTVERQITIALEKLRKNLDFVISTILLCLLQ